MGSCSETKHSLVYTPPFLLLTVVWMGKQTYNATTVTDETLRCNFICYCRQLSGAIAMEEMSAGNRCHLNMFCDNVPTALGGRGPTAGHFDIELF